MVKEKKHLAETSNPASLQTMKPQPVSREYVLIHLPTGNLTGLGMSAIKSQLAKKIDHIILFAKLRLD